MRGYTHAEFSPEADAVYVYLGDEAVASTEQLDDHRMVDYSADGKVVGVEFLGVSAGVDLSDIPCRESVEKAVEELLKSKGLSIRIVA